MDDVIEIHQGLIKPDHHISLGGRGLTERRLRLITRWEGLSGYLCLCYALMLSEGVEAEDQAVLVLPSSELLS